MKYQTPATHGDKWDSQPLFDTSALTPEQVTGLKAVRAEADRVWEAAFGKDESYIPPPAPWDNDQDGITREV